MPHCTYGSDFTVELLAFSGEPQVTCGALEGGRSDRSGRLPYRQSTQLSLMPLIFRQTTICGIAVAPRSSFDRMNEFLNQHAISPVIDHVNPFEQAREAYEHLSKGAFGKL